MPRPKRGRRRIAGKIVGDHVDGLAGAQIERPEWRDLTFGVRRRAARLAVDADR
jgi:uncharacterized protein YcfJ